VALQTHWTFPVARSLCSSDDDDSGGGSAGSSSSHAVGHWILVGVFTVQCG